MFIYEVPEHERETHHYGKAQNQPHYGKTKVCFPGWRFAGPAHRPEDVDVEKGFNILDESALAALSPKERAEYTKARDKWRNKQKKVRRREREKN